jgi:hypothetical protein
MKSRERPALNQRLVLFIAVLFIFYLLNGIAHLSTGSLAAKGI